MKRLGLAAVSIILCIILFSGCNIAEKHSKDDDLAASLFLAKEEVKEGTVPAVSEKAPVSDSDESDGEHSLFSGSSYLNILAADYEILSEAYGSPTIHASSEGGLYAIFESAQVFCEFDISMFDKFYDSYDSWLSDENEFKWGEGYDEGLYYIGDRYSLSDFAVEGIQVYGDGVNALFEYDFDEPVMLSALSKYFDGNEDKITPHEADGRYQTAAFKDGGNYINFEVTPIGGDYKIDVVTIRENDEKFQLPSQTALSANKKEMKDVFFEEIVGTWRFSEDLLEEGENFYIEIDKDLKFSCVHSRDMGAVLFMGIVRHMWNYSDSINDFPDMLNFEIEPDASYEATGGAFFISMALVDGRWQLYLDKTSGGRTMLDLVQMRNYHILYRDEKEKGALKETKIEETFTAKVWERDALTGTLWLERGDFLERGSRFVSYSHEAAKYQLCPDPDMGGLYMLYEGNVYVFTTDSSGEIITVRNAEADVAELLDDDEIMKLACEILYERMPDYRIYIDMGMKALFTGETSVIDGKTCYDISVGTDHEEHFVREVHYSVDLNSERVYIFDFIDAGWMLAL